MGTRENDDSLIAVQLTVDLKPNLPGLSLSLSQLSSFLLLPFNLHMYMTLFCDTTLESSTHTDTQNVPFLDLSLICGFILGTPS